MGPKLISASPSISPATKTVNFNKVHIKDATGGAISLQDFSVQFKDAPTPPPQQTFGVRMLTEAVGSCCPVQREKLVRSGNYEISAAVSTPWFEEYRECFLSIIIPSDHEFLRHYTACVFVVSSKHPDPMNQFAQMTIAQHQQQTHSNLVCFINIRRLSTLHEQQTPAKPPKWFAIDLCRYYVLLHDCIEAEDSKAEGVYQSMKSKYGVHSCHLLKINSVSPNPDTSALTEPLPDPWSNFIKQRASSDLAKESPPIPEVKANGVIDKQDSLTSITSESMEGSEISHPLVSPSAPVRRRTLSGNRRRPRTRSVSERGCWLSTHDHDRLKTFVQEFVVRALIPWAERLIKAYNELYQSKKRGGSLLKSLFNRGKQSESKPSAGGYGSESAEMQLRRLGDLCFMFQLYEQAYSVYHTLKKDFEGDKMWMYCAGAQELASLSIFMQGMAAQKSYPPQYMEGAIDVYQSCKSQSYMTRAVFLSTEVLKVRGLWLQAAAQFLKLTGEEFDLRSAVLLEQAAYCYLNMPSPQIRKFAFYMVLAGHRYSKASQRKHSLRCYDVSLQVYESKSWALAENHIGATISRLSSQLNNYLQALSHASKLLAESTETALQQSTYLKEYLQLYQTVRGGGEKTLPDMAVPLIVDNEIMITTDQFDMSTNSTVYSDDVRWGQLEEACVLKSQNSLPLVLQRSIPSYNRYMKNSQSPRSVLGETQFVRVLLYNPLKLAIQMREISVDWRFQPSGEEEYTQTCKDNPDIVQQTAIPVLELSPLQRQWILFRLVPKALGMLNLLSITYGVSYKDPATGGSSAAIQGKILLNVRGPRLNNTKQEKSGVTYGPDKRLLLSVQPPMPKIKVVFQSFPAHMQCGEMVKVPITVTNVGVIGLQRLHVTCSEPDMIVIPEYTNAEDLSPTSRTVIALDTKTQTIGASETLNFDVWLRAEDIPTSTNINFVFYYESVNEPAGSKTRHRCSRYSFILRTTSELRAQCSTHIRNVKDGKDLGNYVAAIMLHNCSPPSSEAAIEFAVTDVLCKSRLWTLSALNADLSTNVKVNQSEVALLSAHLNHIQGDQSFQLSKVHLNSEEVETHNDVIDGFLSTPFIKPEADTSEEEKKNEEVHVVLGVLWKGFRMDVNGVTTQSIGLHCLPVTSVKDEVETKTARSPSVGSQYAVLEIPRRAPSSRATLEVDDSQGIEYQLLYQTHVTADMSKTRVCVIPVTLVIKSYSQDEVSIAVSHKAGAAADGLMWSGKSVSNVKIPACEEARLELNVTVLRYGVYNLNSLSLSSPGNVFIREHSHVPTLLVVERG